MRNYQKAEARKPEILENYYQVLIEEGFEGTSIGKIAKRMSIHPSLIIHYFKTKENMTVELVDRDMFKRFRDYLVDELDAYKKEGIVKVADVEKAADAVVTLMEGLEFHAHFLSEDRPFGDFAGFAKKLTLEMLKGDRAPEELSAVTWSQDGKRGE